VVYTVVNQSSSNDDRDDGDSSGGIVAQQSKAGAGFWDLELELKALKTILTPTSEWATKVYSACKPELFHHGITKSIFNRLKSLMDKADSFDLPTLDFILSDSKLTPDVKQNLRESFYGSDGNPPVATVQSQGDYDILVKGLSSLAKTRAIYQATHKAANELLDSQEPTEIVKQITSTLGDSLFKFDSDDDMTNEIRMGTGYNQSAEDSFSRIINGSFDQLRIKTGFKEFDEKTGGWHKTNLVIIGGSSGGGKCKEYQGLIPTNLGILQIGDIHKWFSDSAGWQSIPLGILKVYTREGIRDVNGIFKGEGVTLKVTTEWGDEFDALGEHKLYCYDTERNVFGYKQLDQMQVSDWVLKAVGTGLFGSSTELNYEETPKKDVKSYPSHITSALATIFGLMVAEGHRAVSFTNKDASLLSLMITNLRDIFGCERKVREGHTINLNSELERYFTHFTGDVKSAERFIPKCIMQSPEDIQCSFLSALYEGDGCIYEVNKGGKKGKESKVWALEYTTISHRLAYDLKALLENMGIYCRLVKGESWASNGSENQVKKPKFTIFILRESYALFQQKIGFLSEIKKTELSRCVAYCTEQDEAGNLNYQISGLYNKIPKSPVVAYINRVFDLMKDQEVEVQGKAWGKDTSYKMPAGKYHIFYPNATVKKVLNDAKSYVSKYAAQLIISGHQRSSARNTRTKEPVAPHIHDLVENDPELVKLREQINMLCSQVWAQVATVEKKTESVPVFDLSVPGPHEYAANGLMSHNSLLAINYLVRQYRMGYKVVLASYEMTEDECLIRILANISEVDMNNIQNNRLTPPEVERVNAAWREFNLIGHQKGNYFNLICPRNETTVPEIGYRVRSLKPDVLILDYINLLAPSSGSDEAQWQALGNISRESKLLANKLNCVVVLLAQVDDAYNLRYSKGIKDHANFVTAFIRDAEAKENRTIKMKQLKARNAPLYDYELSERFDVAQFRDPNQGDRTEWPDRDQLMMLEIQCHQLGLKLEPTASKEFDQKIRAESKQVVKNISVEEEPTQEEEEQVVTTPLKQETPNLLFSGDDAIPQDFSKSYVKSTFASLLKNENAMYEDTV
jgi:replicative DNA helicase